MKIDRVQIESKSIPTPIHPERIVRDDRDAVTADAVTFEGEKRERESLFNQSGQKEEQETPQNDAEKPKLPSTAKRLIDVVV